MLAPIHKVPDYEGWEEDWLEAFVDAAQKGADRGTAQAIAWAKVCSKRVRNPAAAEAQASEAGGKRARLGVVPPARKGKPSTWRPTRTGRFRARLGSLPPKWKQEWVRSYKRALKRQVKRTDLSEDQQKTVAAKEAWDAVKKQGCRIPESARPSPRKAVYVPPNKRARDRDKKYQKWVCPEWESTERARKRMTEAVRREAKKVEKRERKRQREVEKKRKEREGLRREFERSQEYVRKEAVKRQTPQEYGEAFRRKHGAYGLLPAEPVKRKKPPSKPRKKTPKTKAATAAEIRFRREHAPQTVREYDARKTYKTGDLISHHRYGYGQVVGVKGKQATVKFEKRGYDRKSKRKLRMGQVKA